MLKPPLLLPRVAAIQPRLSARRYFRPKFPEPPRTTRMIFGGFETIVEA